LKLIWVSTGVDDGLMPSTRTTVEMLKKHGFEPVFIESPVACPANSVPVVVRQTGMEGAGNGQSEKV
jgi:hypothetical protein